MSDTARGPRHPAGSTRPEGKAGETTFYQYGHRDGDRIVPYTSSVRVLLLAMFGQVVYRRTVTGANARLDGGLLDGGELRRRDGLPSGGCVYGEWEQLVRRPA